MSCNCNCHPCAHTNTLVATTQGPVPAAAVSSGMVLNNNVPVAVVTGVTCGLCNQNPCACSIVNVGVNVPVSSCAICGNNPCTCPSTYYSINSSTTAITTGWTTAAGSLIINNIGSGNISMSVEAYVHYFFEPRSEKHMEAYAHLTEKGDWPESFKDEMKNAGVKLGDQPTIWRELLDLKIHKVHGGFCANREQLLLDFLQWADAGDISLAVSKSGDTNAHYEPLDDSEAAELVRAYLDSGL